MKSPLLTSFDDFKKWMHQTKAWTNPTYDPKEDDCRVDKPDKYPCVAINNIYQDYDGRIRDHLEFVTYEDFDIVGECYYCDKLLRSHECNGYFSELNDRIVDTCDMCQEKNID